MAQAVQLPCPISRANVLPATHAVQEAPPPADPAGHCVQLLARFAE